MGCSLKPVILLQVYFMLTSRTCRGIYLRWAALVQRLLSTRSSYPLKYMFLKHLLYSSRICLYDIWDLPWTEERTQECQDRNPGRNLLRPPRQNENSFMHATGVILKLHDDVYNSYGCGYQHSVVTRVPREKHYLPPIRPYEAYFVRLVSGPYYG